MEYQFLEIVLAHLLAVISPGPDFILISRQTMLYGRNISIYTSLGIAVGILFHVSYCIVGIEIITSNSIIKQILTVFCSLYLAYLGIGSILVSKSIKNIKFSNNLSKQSISKIKAFSLGLITNLLNVKATIFFLALYTYIDTYTYTNIKIKIFYGLWMFFITGLWFVILSIFLTNKFFIKYQEKYYLIINRMMGCILLYISIKIYLNSIK